MQLERTGSEALAPLRDLVGYLNFSSGASDTRFLAAINTLVGQIESSASDDTRACDELRRLIGDYIQSIEGASEAFRDLTQAKIVTQLVFDELLPAYRRHHADLLYHQPPERLFRPLFLGRAFEAVLAQRPPWAPSRRVVEGALDHLNDYLGYRPVAVLRSAQKIEPYRHERLRPIPYYIQGVGVGIGRYHDLIAQALAILESTDPSLLSEMHFDLGILEELAVDPRSYDFDHPVNKRPNYQFGQWDPHHVSGKGYYARFVIQEVTLACIRERLAERSDAPREELLYEAGAVLAGTILMAACTSGSGPGAHDSDTTLATLLPRIARHRDAFYEQLLARVPGAHGERLRAEAALLRQPFGGARQHLNQRLAQLRAMQLQHVHLAQLYARMGFAEASLRQAHIVSVTSARMLCEINTRITAAYHELEHARLDEAAALAPTITDMVHRAIECGALVDPWNILGFQGQFSLFPAMENTVGDHRVDVLIHVMRQIFGLYARLEGEAAVADRADLGERLVRELTALAAWWDQFATTDVADVDSMLGREVVESAERVAQALGAWKRAGAAAGAVAFWRPHVERFDSPKAYALVLEALLEKRDFVASRALLVQWVSQVEVVPLEEGDHSFHELAVRWTAGVCEAARQAQIARDERTRLVTQFVDYLEANADAYWEVPGFQGDPPRDGLLDDDDDLDEELADELDEDDEEEDDEDEDGERNVYRAAYEDMSYRDSAWSEDDGALAEDLTPPSDYELDQEMQRISRRLAFLVTLARVWRTASAALASEDGRHDLDSGASDAAARDTRADRREFLDAWFERAQANRRRLLDLLQAVHDFRIPAPRGSHESMVEYDRRRLVKETLLARIIFACVEMAGAARLVLAAADDPKLDELDLWEWTAVELVRALLAGDRRRAQELAPQFIAAIERKTTLYIPLAKNGSPRQIVEAQTIQQLLLLLLAGLPRLGLLRESCDLLAAARAMERNRPSGEGGITEFDRLFEVCVTAVVECLVEAAPDGVARGPAAVNETAAALELVDVLQTVAESLLRLWLAHSRSLRLSAMEKVAEQDRWQALVRFVERYGHDLLTQRFMNLGNLRAIWHQGVDHWLRRLESDSDAAEGVALVADLDRTIGRREAVEALSVVIEAIVENYGEYKDFNSTTTQSDRGELLYTLLDFLRLKASYDRFAWNIRPVVMIHQVLVRCQRPVAAELWRRAVAERTSEVADWHLARHAELVRRYGMRLPTVAERLEQRFIQPLTLDRIRSLVPMAMEDARRRRTSTAFSLLEQEIEEFTERPAGAGLDVPAWLAALEHEVDRADPRLPTRLRLDAKDIFPRVPLPWDEAQRHARSWTGDNQDT